MSYFITKKTIKRNFFISLFFICLSFPLYFFYREHREWEWVFGLTASLGWFFMVIRVLGPVIATWVHNRIPGFLDGRPYQTRIFRDAFLIKDRDEQ